MVLASTPALAAEYIDVTPTKGKIGDRVNVFGQDFTPNAVVYIYFSSEPANVGDRLTNVIAYHRVKTTQAGLYGTYNDVIDDYFYVPEELTQGDVSKSVRGGTYYIYAVYTVSPYYIEARAEFTVESTGQIILDRKKGAVGTEVEISGQGFDDREDITIEYDGDQVDIESGDDATDRDGEFEDTIIIIPESTAGQHTITVIGGDSNTEATVEFTVEPKITVTPKSGVAGDSITVSGTGFGNRVDFSIFFDNFVVIADETTNRRGSFEATFAVLSREPGSYDIEAEDEDNNSDKANFTIAKAAVSLGSAIGYAGTEVSVSGTGFRASQEITITFDVDGVEVEVKKATSAADGSFSTSFTVPDRTAGTYKVKVSDGTNTVESAFEIFTGASISPATSAAAPGHVGSQLTVSGVGFTIGRTVTITYDGNQVATAIVNTEGTFSATFSAPTSTGGEHSIIATDGTNIKPFTFTMESASPAIPLPLKPEMDIKAETEAYFDWEDVTDLSGVTYTLQIAVAEDFSADSIVLEKTGLSSSEYTITKEERLKSVSKDAPYYWHVKAVDGASNESQWAGTGAFYVGGFSLALSQPTIYTLFGIGALLLAVFGFWLGRKTAYY